MENQYEARKALIKKNQAENNRRTIRDYKLKQLDGPPAIRQYNVEIKRVNDRKHLTVVKEQTNETINS